MSRGDDQRVADILDAANELAEVIRVGHEAFRTSSLRARLGGGEAPEEPLAVLLAG